MLIEMNESQTNIMRSDELNDQQLARVFETLSNFSLNYQKFLSHKHQMETEQIFKLDLSHHKPHDEVLEIMLRKTKFSKD